MRRNGLLKRSGLPRVFGFSRHPDGSSTDSLLVFRYYQTFFAAARRRPRVLCRRQRKIRIVSAPRASSRARGYMFLTREEGAGVDPCSLPLPHRPIGVGLDPAPAVPAAGLDRSVVNLMAVSLPNRSEHGMRNTPALLPSGRVPTPGRRRSAETLPPMFPGHGRGANMPVPDDRGDSPGVRTEHAAPCLQCRCCVVPVPYEALAWCSFRWNTACRRSLRPRSG